MFGNYGMFGGFPQQGGYGMGRGGGMFGGFGGNKMGYGGPQGGGFQSAPWNPGGGLQYAPQNASAGYNPMTGPTQQVSGGQKFNADGSPNLGFGPQSGGMPQTGGPFNPMIGGGYMAGRGPGPQTGGMEPKPTYTLGQGSPIYNPNPNDPNSLDLGGWSSNEIPGSPVNQAAQNGSAQAPQLATTGNTPIAGMGAAALNDPNLPMMYRQQLQAQFGVGMPQQPNKGYNFGTYGQAPVPQANQFPPGWGPQDMGFNPRGMAGTNVQGNQAWYYGRDAVGRPINNQGDAYAQFSGAADGFSRARPWISGGG